MSTIERRRMFSIGLYCAMTILTLCAGMQPATARALIGAAAPAFTLTDSSGRNLSLADFKGKTVVLEWTNHECPYVGKHYRGNNMQALQKKWTGQGVVWLSVISSAPGQPGYVSPQQANQLTADRGAAPTAVLFDPTGEVGHAYGARTTPHMYVINGEGALIYNGGIDDRPTARLEDLKSARNFVDQALSEISQGKPVSVTSARAYGCSIKYGSFRGGILPKSACRRFENRPHPFDPSCGLERDGGMDSCTAAKQHLIYPLTPQSLADARRSDHPKLVTQQPHRRNTMCRALPPRPSV